MSAHATPWRPLGVLLVENGVISEAELETALADQEASGRPLGEILIAHGFSSRPAIQDALAEQCGVMFEPERGFGTGLRGLLARRHRQRKDGVDVEDSARPQLAVVPPLAELEDEAELGLVAAAAALAEARAPSVNLLRSVELPQLVAPQPPPPSVEAQLDELRTAQERTSDELTRIGDALARVQAELAELRAAPVVAPAPPQPEPVVEPEPAAIATAPEPATAVGHLRFVLEGGVYRIETHEGPPPAIGDRLELAARSFRVVKLGHSPLPNDERRCAYLLGD